LIRRAVSSVVHFELHLHFHFYPFSCFRPLTTLIDHIGELWSCGPSILAGLYLILSSRPLGRVLAVNLILFFLCFLFAWHSDNGQLSVFDVLRMTVYAVSTTLYVVLLFVSLSFSLSHEPCDLLTPFTDYGVLHMIRLECIEILFFFYTAYRLLVFLFPSHRDVA
jgi:hypothetical protein